VRLKIGLFFQKRFGRFTKTFLITLAVRISISAAKMDGAFSRQFATTFIISHLRFGLT
jgi:hypothetical protein